MQHLAQLAQPLPLQVAAKVLIKPVHRRDVRVREHRHRTGRLQHVDQHEMLVADEVKVAHKAVRQQRIIKRGKKNQQRTPPQPQPDERAKLLKVRRHDARLQRVERIAARAVMRLAVLGAHELSHRVAERDEPEVIALFLRRQPEHERGGDEAFEN